MKVNIKILNESYIQLKEREKEFLPERKCVLQRSCRWRYLPNGFLSSVIFPLNLFPLAQISVAYSELRWKYCILTQHSERHPYHPFLTSLSFTLYLSLPLSRYLILFSLSLKPSCCPPFKGVLPGPECLEECVCVEMMTMLGLC